MRKNDLCLLDCTLRDGGYYNDWDFEPHLVDEYLQAVAKAGIEFVELGLRNFPKDKFLGPFAYTTEQFLNSLELPKGPTYGVMVDAKTILTADCSVAEAIDRLFVPANKSKIKLVRVAAHFAEVEESEELIKRLKDLGYIVGFNLMQAAGKSDDVIREKTRAVRSWDAVDTLYFADSLGNMDQDEVTRIITVIKGSWDGALGIHAHNNMGKALDNSLCANKLGVSWLDVTVTGMGRGAGNTQTESMLATLTNEINNYVPGPVYELVVRHFEPMQKQYGWGSSLLYFIGAQHEIHPTYVQKLLSSNRYGPDELVGAIEYLSREETTSYDGFLLEEALNLNSMALEVTGGNEVKGLFVGCEVLIVANGPSVSRYLAGIESYIREHKPVVLCVNMNDHISPDLVDYYVISHNVKFLSEKMRYNKITQPIILPRQRFSEEELAVLNPNAKQLDYGLEISADGLSTADDFCAIPYELTGAYAFGIAITGQAKSIKIVGFDGYPFQDSRQEEMVQVFHELHGQYPGENILALTPSTYQVNQGSIYAPVV